MSCLFRERDKAVNSEAGVAPSSVVNLKTHVLNAFGKMPNLNAFSFIL